ncbi:hypothetical protein B296_00008935 [Ensete ventricosum]|uniref:Uncharacterized protein n=1 Tax=Ensete ventricosum TaxID=4639 RepID=A0A426ZES8_ENSVE|nr:hypothetical protein B296_00008935 [Ensete ventricosum]
MTLRQYSLHSTLQGAVACKGGWATRGHDRLQRDDHRDDHLRRDAYRDGRLQRVAPSLRKGDDDGQLEGRKKAKASF